MCFLTKTTWEPTGTWTRYKAHGARGMAKIGKVASEVVAAVQEVSFRQSGLDGGVSWPWIISFQGHSDELEHFVLCHTVFDTLGV